MLSYHVRRFSFLSRHQNEIEIVLFSIVVGSIDPASQPTGQPTDVSNDNHEIFQSTLTYPPPTKKFEFRSHAAFPDWCFDFFWPRIRRRENVHGMRRGRKTATEWNYSIFPKQIKREAESETRLRTQFQEMIISPLLIVCCMQTPGIF